MAETVNPFQHDKILNQAKLKAFADDNLNVTKMVIYVFDRVENIMGKRRNCLYKQFLLFPQCFQKPSFPDPSKGAIVWEWVKEALDQIQSRKLFNKNLSKDGKFSNMYNMALK